MTNPITINGKPMGVVWQSSAPWTSYGYGITTRDVVPRLRDRLGLEVAISAYYGHVSGKLNWKGIDVYPSGHDAYNNDIGAAHVKQAGADLLLTHQDVWPQNPTQLTANGTRWVSWPPIDSEPIAPQIALRLKAAYQAIALARFGQEQAALAGLDLPLVYQGVDTTVFTPGSRAEVRERLGWPQDAFIVGMIAHNKGYPSRKAYPQQLEAFGQFYQRHKDARIYIHAFGDPSLDREAIPLMWHLERNGAEDAVTFADPYQLNIGYTTEQMVDRYRAFDVLLGCSLSEGFGIPLVEAQACGTPVITGAWTAMTENCFAGWTVAREDSDPFFVAPLECEWRTPHVGAIEEKLEEAYSTLQSRDRCADLSAAARAWAVRERDQDMIVDTQWRPVLEALAQRIEAEPTPFHTHKWAGVGPQTEQGIIAPCLVPNCPAELRVNGTREVAEDGWSVLIDGVRLSIADDPNGGVKHAIAAEVVSTYHLDELTFEPGDVVIDVGAHVGVVSCYLAKKWPGITVYAFEPIPANYDRLVRNIKANGLTNIAAHNLAVTDDGRTLVLSGDPDMNTGHYSAYAERGATTLVCDSVKLADVTASTPHIALLKLDCEGAEYEILHSLGRELGKVNALAMEVHENARIVDTFGTGANLVSFAKTNIPWVRAAVIPVPAYEEVADGIR